MKQHLKQLNATYEEKQKLISKENSKIYSDAVNIVSSENLNSIAYMDVMIKIMDEIIRAQKKKIPTEEIFGENKEEYIRSLCASRPKKKIPETICEALSILGFVFFAGFLAGAVLIGKEMALSVLALVRWSVLLVVGLAAMIYLQRKKRLSQMRMMLMILLVYMAASNTVDILFKNLEDISVSVNTYFLTAFFLLMGAGCMKIKNHIRDTEYNNWKNKK